MIQIYTTRTQNSVRYHDKLPELIMALFCFSLPIARQDIHQLLKRNRCGDSVYINVYLYGYQP